MGAFAERSGGAFFASAADGATDELVAVHKRLADLIGYSQPEERVRPAKFPPPTSDDLSNVAGAHLLWQAARLTLREGATPLRSLGRVSIRPRTYQFVPLLMALRLDPVRLLIADDVGVGKTVEGLPFRNDDVPKYLRELDKFEGKSRRTNLVVR